MNETFRKTETFLWNVTNHVNNLFKMFLIIFSTHSDTFVVYVYWGWRCDLGLFLFLNVKKHDYLHFTKSTSTSVSTPILCLTRFQTPQLWLFMRIPWRGLLSSLPFFSCAHNHVSIIFRRNNTDYYSIKETQKLWNWKNVAFEFFVGINFLRMECKVFFCMRLAFVPNTNYKTSMK